MAWGSLSPIRAFPREAPATVVVGHDNFTITGGGGPTSREVQVDVDACLRDPNRVDPVTDACHLAALVTLSDPSGDLASGAIDLGMVQPQDRIIPHDTLVLVPTYPLVISGAGPGTGSGTVNVPPTAGQPAIACQITDGQAAAIGCGTRYPIHTQLQLTVGADQGVALAAWGGDCVNVAPTDPCTVTMDAPRTASASFRPAPNTGDLEVQIAGLPTGTAAAVTVSNGAGFAQHVTASAVLSGLEAGSYTVAAEPVTVAGVPGTFQPSQSTQTVTVAQGSQTIVQVAYNPPTTGSLSVGITGLPDGLAADVTVTGAEFPQGRHVTASEVLAPLAPGNYVVTAARVTDLSTAQPYDPDPPRRQVGVKAGQGADAPVTYAPAAAAKLVFLQQPSDVVSGAPIAPAVTVQVQDGQGQLAPGYSDAITLSLGGGTPGAKLGGTVSATPVAGVATFADLTVDLAGSGYQLTAASGRLAVARSTTFRVTSGPVSGDRSRVEVSAGTLRTCCDTAQVTVTVLDANGNPIPGATVTVAASGDRAVAFQPTGATDTFGKTTGRVAAAAIGSVTVSAAAGATPIAQTAVLQVVAGIAFESAGTIVVANPDRSTKPAQIGVAAGATDPAWSPDGSKLAVTEFNCQFEVCENDIIVTDANGANPVNVTRGRGQDRSDKSKPSWSPDGTQIAFELACGAECVDIGTVAVAGGDIVDLTPGLGDASDPAWSPPGVGQRIAFARAICDGPCLTAIFVADPATPSKNTRLSLVLAGVASAPAWSPRGDQIVFSILLCSDGCASDLLRLQTDGTSDTVNLTANMAEDATAPAWSPDGSRIAFTEGDCGVRCSPVISLLDPETGRNLGGLARGRNPTWR